MDTRIQNKTSDIFTLKEKYKQSFLEHKEVREELNKIEEEERKIVELKEFATFEINKIQEIDPKDSEDKELLEIKKELSRKEKVLETISSASSIFDSEHFVNSALDLLNEDSSFFDDTMNELRAVFDSAEAKFNALEDINIEEVLNRIEDLSGLKRRYGSIEEAIAYKEQKIIELAKYENIEITKDELVKKEALLIQEVQKLADSLSKLRTKELTVFSKDLNKYLKELYLRDAQVSMREIGLNSYGKDEILIKLNNTELNKVSTGEFNRLRLAVLALKSEFMSKNGGVLMLDEIDANLSGEESMSVAKVLRQLSKHFQIFVISHQPQLTSMGEQHFLVHKNGNESMVKELSLEDRIDEIARIISGDSVSSEAKSFAKELLEASK
ncbi:MAG: DNA repair protein RecN (Recombination protein N) [Sulfurimonas sp.]